MDASFFDHPILNSPYECPRRHWELDAQGQPTESIVEQRRRAEFISPIPHPKKRKSGKGQAALAFDEGHGLSTDTQQYDPTSIINEVRRRVQEWRELDPARWLVTPETARLLHHWRHHRFAGIRPFFCQVEAVETAIWLTEVAPHSPAGKSVIAHLDAANAEANPGLARVALKLATGAGKTTVMAMLIAWQTINAVRRPGSRLFTKGFLVCTPGITIRDRLRVLLPHDPESYYESRELVPRDLMADLNQARIVITNYHAFKHRERMEISAGGRRLLTGRTGTAPLTTETDGQMLQRVLPELMGMKNLLVINDEAHHCYRERVRADEEVEDLSQEEKKEVERQREAARLWISGLEALQTTLGIRQVFDLSATPFFLRGSGYAEGTLFPWTVSDFSLMDAIECGIVKLPRVPVAENIAGDEMPMFRNLWEHIRADMPKKGRARGGALDPLSLPPRFQTALQALYGHYEKTYRLWEEAGISVPPCFIVVCQNTAISKLVYDFVSGFRRTLPSGSVQVENGRLPLFRNFDENGEPLARPRTLLIDSEQLEAGDALDENFRALAADEIERFRREIVERTGDPRAGDKISDQDLLREVMNTVGKADQLGGSIRCVVSVSMLTEGWDANTVTHILGVRAFGTQLLCEQVVGRALRRQSYELNEEGLFSPEYADIFGVPFDFAARPVIPPPQPPREVVLVRALSPERDAREITFPRVRGYRVELPEEQLQATFTETSTLELSPELVGPSITLNRGILGEGARMDLDHLRAMRENTILYHLTQHLLVRHWRDTNGEPRLHLFGQLKRITRDWMRSHLVCTGDTWPAQVVYEALAEEACSRITAAITRYHLEERPIQAILDPYNPRGSTRHVRFTTTKTLRYETSSQHCHLNWVICDSQWEAEFCRVVEDHPRVLAYVKNQGLGFTVPYHFGGQLREYWPDFLVRVDDGRGPEDPLHLVVEIKGQRLEDDKVKHETMETQWVPGVNALGSFGRWAFLEFADLHEMHAAWGKALDALVASGAA